MRQIAKAPEEWSLNRDPDMMRSSVHRRNIPSGDSRVSQSLGFWRN